MRILLHSMATPDLTPVEALDLAGEIGFDGIDLVCQADYRCALAPDSELAVAAQIRREASARGLTVGALTPYEKRFANENDAVRQAAMNAFHHAIRLAQTVGAGSVRVLAGFDVPQSARAAEIERMAGALQYLAEEAAACGVGLNIENHDGSLTDDAARTVDLWRRVDRPNVGIIYDPANLTRDRKEEFPESYALQASAIRLVHVKDYIFTKGVTRDAADGNSRRCVPVGEGVIPWSDVLRALHAGGYRGDLSLEYEMRWWPDQLPPVRTGAARSLAFLRRIVADIGARPTPA